MEVDFQLLLRLVPTKSLNKVAHRASTLFKEFRGRAKMLVYILGAKCLWQLLKQNKVLWSADSIKKRIGWPAADASGDGSQTTNLDSTSIQVSFEESQRPFLGIWTWTRTCL